MITLKEKLEQWRSDDLKKYVYLLGGKSSVQRKAERVTFIQHKMIFKDSLRAVWQELDEISRRAISVAYYNGGEFDSGAFVAQYGQLPPRPQKEKSWYYSKQPILFDLFVINGHIPDDLMRLLADLVLPLERFQLEGQETIPSEVTRHKREWDVAAVETELIGRADLLTYLQMVEQ
ncbi:MAG: hypothetical protein ACE5EY_16040, partial [Anaerolineae bacterium]